MGDPWRQKGARRWIERDATVLALVPHFRCERWLDHCLASLLAQTRPPDAIVVIDDASPEPPVDIVRRYPAASLLVSEGNVGPYRLVQQVIDDTRFDAYLFQDADDWSAPDRLERLLLAAELTGAGLVGSDYLMVRCDDARTLHHAFPLDVNATLAEAPTAHALQHPTSLVARELVVELGGYATGMRFSGDDEFLRRAAHLARVVNVPRLLYYRRHRTDSLTTAPETGHGSNARRQVLQALASRAEENAQATARGDAPDLSPFSRALPVGLTRLAGPPLEPPPQRSRTPASRSADGAATISDVERHRSPLPEATAPTFVIGAPGSGDEVLACAIAQHPSVCLVPDVAWMGRMARAALSASALPGRGTVLPGVRRELHSSDAVAAGAPHVLRATGIALSALVLGSASSAPAGPEPEPEELLRRVAHAHLTGEHTWVASGLPPDDDLPVLLRALPGARLIHVVRDADDVAPLRADDTTDPYVEWLGAVRRCLAAEEVVGPDRVVRVRHADLAADPEGVLRRCLAFLDLEQHDWCAAAVPDSEPVAISPAATLDSDADHRQRAADLSIALCGPRPPATPRARTADVTPASRPKRPSPHPLPPTVTGPVALVQATVPPDAIVAVVSRGDDRLLELGTATGWHYPQTDDGTWLGHHPATGAEAVAYLRHLEERGATHLCVPGWATWWLDFYTDLRDHLDRTAEVLATGEAGTVYHLAVRSAQATASALREHPTPTPRTRGSSRRPTATVLAWDLAHNPVGRAHLLAELLSERFDVELVGGCFERFGTSTWAPLRDSRLQVRSFPGADLPDLFTTMEATAATIRSDLLVVSKPRLPSLGIGILAKERTGAPILLDVDDRELAFVGADRGLPIDELEQRRDNPSMFQPYGRLWTQFCDSLVSEADAVTVSNHTLRELYGGVIVPHARDERLFDPARFDRDRARARFGFGSDDRVVLFAGTPRRHKGIVEVATALRQIGDPRLRLCVIGTAELDELREELRGLEPWLHILPYQPFEELPELLAAADLTTVLQDPGNPVAQHQIPAKVTDALAMGVPCLVTRVPPLEPLIESGHLLERRGGALARQLSEIFDDYSAVRRAARANRELFLERYSYSSVRSVLEASAQRAMQECRPFSPTLERIVTFQRGRFAADDSGNGAGKRNGRANAPVALPTRRADTPVDVVMFWKQNDSSIYGRRHDMLVEQLVAHPEVHQVIQFDAPVTAATLLREPPSGVPTHDELVRDMTMQRMKGLHTHPKLHQYTFVDDDQGMPAARVRPNGSRGSEPDRAANEAYVAELLDRHGTGRRPLVFWVYPKRFDFPSLCDRFRPDAVVMDVVDDHRTWGSSRANPHDAVVTNYLHIAARADVIVANCEAMVTAVESWGHQAALVPNGCEHPVRLRDRTPPPELQRLEGPLVGYVGNLSSRIDVPLLAHVAAAHPDWNIVLIGSAHAGQDVLALREWPNVYFLGPRPYEEAKRYISCFDVGIIPHLDNAMTRTMHPLKAWVYCALGVPIVSTDIANLGELRPFVWVARNANDFTAGIEAQLGRDRSRTDPALVRVLTANSWRTRADRILGLVRERLAAQGEELVR